MKAEGCTQLFILHPSYFILAFQRYLSVALSVGSHGCCHPHFAALALPSTVPCAARTFLAPEQPPARDRRNDRSLQ